MSTTCSVCGIQKSLSSKFYYNSKYGKNLCNKHYLQIKNNNKITDPTQPKIDDKRIYWTKDEEDKLRELVGLNKSYPEISKILNRTRDSISDKVLSMNIPTQFKNSIHFKAIYQDYNWCYQKYIVEGLNHDEMAEEANCTKRVIEKWCCEKHKLTQEYRKIHKHLNKIQKDLIVGSMLGDGHIDRREEQPMFIVVHVENQKDYLYFKYDILKDFCNIPPTRKEECYREFYGKQYLCQPSYRLCTRIHDCFLDYRNKTYTYLLNLMNEFSFSIWMLDDGYRSNSNWELCVAEYSTDDVNLALKLFKEKYSLNAKVKKDIRYLEFDADSSRLIDKIILKNIPNDLDVVKYKITENNISKKQKTIYVNYDNENIKLKELCNNLQLDYKFVWAKLNSGFDINEIIDKMAVNI